MIDPSFSLSLLCCNPTYTEPESPIVHALDPTCELSCIPMTPETSSANSTARPEHAKIGDGHDAINLDDLSSLPALGPRKVCRAVVEGHAYTLKLIAGKTSYAKSTVCEYPSKLRKLGLVEIVGAFNIAGRRQIKYYLPAGSRDSA